MTTRRLTLLAIEDDLGHAELLRRRLECVVELEFDYTHCSTPEQGLQALADHPIDAILVDYRLGARTAVEVVKAIRDTGYSGPVIVLTSLRDDGIAKLLFDAGADDYLDKNDLSSAVLAPILERIRTRADTHRPDVHPTRLTPPPVEPGTIRGQRSGPYPQPKPHNRVLESRRERHPNDNPTHEAPDAIRHRVILAIDDDAGDAEILRRYLGSIPDLDCEFIHHTQGNTGLSTLAERHVDVLFLDYLLGAGTGLELLGQVRSGGFIGPIIVLTGQGDEAIAAQIMRAGADDYLIKDLIAPDVLDRSVKHAEAQYLRRCAERELLQKNALLAELYKTAHEFVDHVSHEFRTPLSVMKEFTSILHDGLAGEINDEQREYLDIISSRVDDLSAMVDDMLDISRLEAGLLGVYRRNCEVTDIIAPIWRMIDHRAATRRVRLECDIEPNLPTVFGDPEKLGRVIINLTVNALKFVHEEGRVRLWARHERETDQVRVGITDNGPGIDPTKRQFIFERFQQIHGSARAATRGFGLGLNIAKELVQIHFGDITVESEDGRGSTFSFTIPITEPFRILNRYLDQVAAHTNDQCFISLLAVRADSPPEDNDDTETHRLLHDQLRRHDLLLPTGPNTWAMLTVAQQEEPSDAILRVNEAREEFNRNHPGEPLPPIALEFRGTWRVPDQRIEVARAIQELCPAPSLCGA